MNKLSKIIKELKLDDLKLIKRDLEAGHIDKLIKQEIKNRQGNKSTYCPVCSAPIKEGEGLHIQFGPKTFRKKATFDGADCLTYFLEHNLKKK